MWGPCRAPVGMVGSFPTLGSSQWDPAMPLVSEAGVPEWQMGGRNATGIRKWQLRQEWLCPPPGQAKGPLRLSSCHAPTSISCRISPESSSKSRAAAAAVTRPSVRALAWGLTFLIGGFSGCGPVALSGSCHGADRLPGRQPHRILHAALPRWVCFQFPIEEALSFYLCHPPVAV